MVAAGFVSALLYLMSLTVAGSGAAGFVLGLVLQGVAFVLLAYLIVGVTS